MQFRPLFDRVAVRRDSAEKKIGSIIVPENHAEAPSLGEIIAAGPGRTDDAGELIPLSVSVGQRIIFGKWSGSEIKLNGETLLIMREGDVLGVLEE